MLDKGFVSLIDFLGGDLAVVQAARVSFGQETKGDERDRKLINYLMHHEHGTPFEMSVFKFHIKAPIFVARQWMRHRVGCLSGETLLHFDLPLGKWRGKSKLHKTSLGKLYELWHEGSAHRVSKHKPLFLERVKADESYTVTELARLVERRAETLHGLIRRGELCAARDEDAKGNRPQLRVKGRDWHVYAQKTFTARVPCAARVRRMNLRMCNEETGVIEHTRIADIWQSGTKPVYRVTLENGYQIKMTEDHRCLTEKGWMTLRQATDLRRTASGAVVWDSESPAFAANGESAHRNYEWLAARRREQRSIGEIAAQAGVSYHTIRKSLAKFNLQYSPKERGRLSGDKQRGQKRGKINRAPLSEQALSKIRAARSGERSNFWKGGASSERANIARWTREQAARVHARYDYSCAICQSHKNLHAHHVAPVWNEPERARDFDNLVSLCGACHRRLHGQNLELRFQEVFYRGGALRDFWNEHPTPAPQPARKPRPASLRLMRIYSPVARIEYAGDEMTYDVEVTGPFHNFVANGFVVHNSYNEISYRYVEVEDEFYVPVELRAQDTKNKQASLGGSFAEEQNAEGCALIEAAYAAAYQNYKQLLQMGVAREMARIVLPVGMYTQFYVAYNARSLMNFVRLRMGEGAQTEIRLYAEAMNRIFKEVMPWTHDAFERFMLKREETA